MQVDVEFPCASRVDSGVLLGTRVISISFFFSLPARGVGCRASDREGGESALRCLSWAGRERINIIDCGGLED